MHKPLSYSVAIATYNGSRYIGEQLESIFSQSVRPNEIIISDDGSSDDTLAIAEKLCSSSGIEFRIVRNKYARGYTTNFSTALECTSGEIVLLCDQDDIWFPNKIEAITSIFLDSDAEMIVHDAHVWWSEKKACGPLISEILVRRDIDPKENIYGCMMAVRRTLLNVALPIDTNLIGHDALLSLLAVSRGSKRYLAQPLMLYRRHDLNASKSLFSQPDRRALTRKFLSLSFDYGWLKRKRNELTAFHQVVSRKEGEQAIPTSAMERLEEDLQRVNLRYVALFDGGFFSVFWRLREYRRTGVSLTACLKDLVACVSGLHRIFTK